jgi:hypothetical protein
MYKMGEVRWMGGSMWRGVVSSAHLLSLPLGTHENDWFEWIKPPTSPRVHPKFWVLSPGDFSIIAVDEDVTLALSLMGKEEEVWVHLIPEWSSRTSSDTGWRWGDGLLISTQIETGRAPHRPCSGMEFWQLGHLTLHCSSTHRLAFLPSKLPLLQQTPKPNLSQKLWGHNMGTFSFPRFMTPSGILVFTLSTDV